MTLLLGSIIASMGQESYAQAEIHRLYEKEVRERLEKGLGELVSRIFGKPEDPAYLILGVFPSDPIQMIDAVYRAKAKILHPDNKLTGDAERFKTLNKAYHIVREWKEQAS